MKRLLAIKREIAESLNIRAKTSLRISTAEKCSENRRLETVAYRFTFHYFSGNKSYENAWYFDQKYTNEDLTAP